jgi:hypothetical protein
MPTGLVVMRWDERIGAEIIGNYPIEAKIAEKTMMQIYAQHEYSGEAGMVTLNVGALNLASYFCGPDHPFYIILMLEAEEDGLDFETGLTEMSRQIVEAAQNPAVLKDLIPNIFQRLAVYPHLTDEQKLGIILQDEIKRLIFQRLREEVVIPRSEIEIWLKDQYRGSVIFDIEGSINALLKQGLVKIASVKGVAADLIFFVQDIMMLRHPPVELIKDPVGHHLPKSMKRVYIGEVRKFFQSYKIGDEDSLKVITKALLDPQIYEVIVLMRQAIVTRQDLEKLRKKGVTDLDYVLRTLWDLNMVTVIQDQNETEYYGLLCDFSLTKYYPTYNIDTILRRYKEKSETVPVLLKALDIMREEYLIQNAPEDKKAKKEREKKEKEKEKQKKAEEEQEKKDAKNKGKKD